MLAAVMDGDPDARHPLVERYFRAMQRGQEGEEELVALFAEDAVYVEPFSGDQARRTSAGPRSRPGCTPPGTAARRS